MKIALLGYGKMGTLIEVIAQKAGHSVCAKLSRQNTSTEKDLLLADVCIDFSRRECVLEHINLCIRLNKPLIIGTTGWENDLKLVKELVNSSTIGCLYSSNFSIGIALFNEIIAYAAKKMAEFTEYDVTGIEYHHKEKIDAPSGTAKTLINLVGENMPKKHPIFFSSVRCGHLPGTHTIRFDSPGDSVTLTHTARNREGFALGAIEAAEWILDKKGFYTMQDLVNFRFPTLMHSA